MDHNSESAPSGSSNPVLDYYKKFSRNKDLPKYFRGSVDVPKGPIRNEMRYFGDSNSNDSLKDALVSAVNKSIPNIAKTVSDIIDLDITIQLEDHEKVAADLVDAETLTDFDTHRGPSPTSSVTSNRKLEWDNGADIGYGNITDRNLHKSLSLPTLNSLEKIASEAQVCRQSPDGKPAESAPRNNANLSESDGSSLEQKKFNNVSTATSSYRKSSSACTSTSSASPRVYTNFSNDEFVEQNAGSPVAKSTPHINMKTVGKSAKSLEQKGDAHVELQTGLKPKKPFKLCVSKPIVVECFGDVECKNKQIQTTLPHNASAGIQTDAIINEPFTRIQKEDYTNPNYVERQNVIYLHHSDRTLDEDGEITHSNSFEFIAGHDLQRPPKTESSASSSLTKNHKPPSEGALTDLLTRKLSNDLIQDVERSIEMLQQVLQSTKYDESTKKKYLRKVARKIIKSKYNDDTSTTSSSKSNASSKTSKSKRNTEMLEQLQKNVPWKPVEINDNAAKPNSSSSKERCSSGNGEGKKQQRNLRKLDVVNTAFEIAATNGNKKQTDENDEELIQPRYEKANKPHHSLFTMTGNRMLSENSKLSTEKNTVNSDPSTINEMHVSSAYSSARKTSDSSPDTDRRSWREDKTLSEKLLEQKLHNMSGDNPDFKNTKKEGQLNWINNEINHLHNLRKILEGNQEEIRRALLDKPEPENKLTSVYLVTTERAPASSKATQYTNDIELQIGAKKYVLSRQPCCKCKKCVCSCSGKSSTDEGERNSQRSDKATRGSSKNSSDELTHTNRIKSRRKDDASTGEDKPDKALKATTKEPVYVKSGQIDRIKILVTSGDEGTNDKNKQASTPNQSPPAIVSAENSDPKQNAETNTNNNDNDNDNKNKDPIVIVLNINKDDCTDDGYAKSSSSGCSAGSTEKLLCSSCKKCFVAKTSSTSLSDVLPEGFAFLCPKCCPSKNNSLKTQCQRHQNTACNCNCYTYVNKQTINDIKRTIKDLDELERQEDCCTCKYRKKDCGLCSTRKDRKGIAYTLNLVPEDFRESAKRKEERKKSVEEITINVPYQAVGKTKQKKHSDEESDESKENAGNNGRKKKRDSNKKRRKARTLQDYLSENKPTFIQSAEERRRYMMELAYIRAKRVEKYKRLLALTSEMPAENNSPLDSNRAPNKGIFSSKEMKKITAKMYKKLPEVQRKKETAKKQQIEKANKLITSIFNEKVRRNVLKGQKDFSTSVSVVNM